MKYFFLTGFVFLFLITSAQQKLVSLPPSKNKIIVIAHRGNHVRVPENTVAAAKEAIRAGADYVEIDLRTTKDGYLVLQHDATVNRMTNGKGNVKDLSLKQINQLSINRNYKVPEFQEILNTCRNRINIYLDFKDGDVAETYRQIKEAGMEKQVVVYINAEAQYAQWRAIAPEVPLMNSLPESVTNEKEFDKFFAAYPFEVLDNVTDSTMKTLTKSKGIAIWLDVQSKDEGPASWTNALDKNVQGLQTDHPDALIEYLKKNGLR
jgi:glycerophosphoryl diester phosphodiesterase